MITGRYRGSSAWRYLARYCFKPADGESAGQLKATFEFENTTSSSISMLLYYLSSYGGGGAEDEWGAWSKVYGTTHSCGERVAEARKMGNQFFLKKASDIVEVSSSQIEVRDDLSIDERYPVESWTRSTVTTRLHTSRNRWFFVTVANCVPEAECPARSPYCAENLNIRYS